MYRRLFLSTVAVTLMSWTGAAQGQDPPLRFDFEADEVGQVPKGWSVPTKGYKAAVKKGKASEGKQYVRLSCMDGSDKAPFGNIMESLDAQPYRGKVVRFTATVRTNGAGKNRAQLWFRVDLPGRQMGFFDNMDDRPITGGKWREYEIVGEVAENAERLNFGLMTISKGRTDLDDVKLEIVGEAETRPSEPARPLNGRALDNLIAFTRLLGYVRYFHPSDPASEVDWDALAIEGVRKVESAGSPQELAATLEKLFGPAAPTVRIFPTGKKPDAVEGPPAPTDEAAERACYWEHHGIELDAGASRGTNEKSGLKKAIESLGEPPKIYYSKRVYLDMKDGMPPAGCPNAGQPFAADLGGGVSCEVPLVVHADRRGTRPRLEKPAQEQKKADSTGPRLTGSYSARLEYSGNDRATRLAAVALAWNVFQHFYPYFDVVQTDWNAALRRALEKAAADADERAFLDTLRELVAQLHDGHGNVWHSCDRSNATLPLLWTWVDDRLVVTQVAEELEEPIKAGDIVEQINGQPVIKLYSETEHLLSAATPQWARWRALSVLAAGKAGDQARLTLKKPDGKQHEVSLDYAIPAQPLCETRPDKINEVKPGIYYVDISRITDANFAAAVPDLAEAKGIIFDFRGYPSQLNAFAFFSHLVKKPVTSPQWHVPLVKQPDRRQMEFERSEGWRIAPQTPYFKGNKVFMVDGRAISYAESCLGIIEHYKLGKIVGGPSAGTNGNVNPFTLPGGYHVVWTGMKVLKHDGSQHHGVGILPTVPMSRTIAGIAAGRDELLERAIEEASLVSGAESIP